MVVPAIAEAVEFREANLLTGSPLAPSLVTSREAPEDKLRGRAVGAQGYIVKSEFDQKALLRQIRGLLT